MAAYFKGIFMDSRGGIAVAEQCDWRHGMVLQEAWDPGVRHERREACGVASIREMGRSVGVSNGLSISL